MNNVIALILAAGKGTRMKSDLPKVLHKISGEPIIFYPIKLLKSLEIEKIFIVIGHHAEEVKNYVNNRYPDVNFVYQETQLGTGHAVMVSTKYIKDFTGTLLVLSGDVPLLTQNTITDLIKMHIKSEYCVTILTTNLDNPANYGRIVRGSNGDVIKIVEHKDATDEEKKIKEINTGIYCFSYTALINSLPKLTTNNIQKEYYITDIIEIMQKDGRRIGALNTPNAYEVMGINSLEELLQLEKIMRTEPVAKL